MSAIPRAEGDNRPIWRGIKSDSSHLEADWLDRKERRDLRGNVMLRIENVVWTSDHSDKTSAKEIEARIQYHLEVR